MFPLTHRLTSGAALCALATAVCLLAPASGAAPASSAGEVVTHVIGGTPVSDSTYSTRWPWMVSLMAPGARNDAAAHFCGGTLLTSSLVVTAAHCVDYDQQGQLHNHRSLQIFHGDRVFSETEKTRRYTVTESFVHPEWQRSLMGYDVAVIRLAEPIAGAQTLPLAGAGESALWGGGAGLADGAWIAGWGTTNPNPFVPAYPTRMREAAVPIVADSRCATSIEGGEAPLFDRKTMICAGVADLDDPRDGVSACYGDSGGPLQVPDGAGGWRLAGITSWGQICGGTFGVFTRVDAMRPWIESIPLAGDGGPGGLQEPTALSQVSATLGSVDVRWTPPATGPAPERYEVYVRTSAGDMPVGITTRTRLRVGGLAPSGLGKPSRYPIVVRSLDADENTSGASVRLLARTRVDSERPTPPGMPQRMEGGRAILLTWRASRDNDRVESYRVYAQVVGESTAKIVAASPFQGAMVRGLRPGTKYIISVVAIDRAGNRSRPSEGLRITTRAAAG